MLAGRFSGIHAGMLRDDDLALLWAENQALRTQLAHAHAQLAQAVEQLAAAQQPLAELEQQRHDPRPFVKSNRPNSQHQQRPRYKRAREHNRDRRHAPPMRIQLDALDRCPDCNYQLRDTSIDYTREVIELPPPPPLEVVEDQVIKRWCPHCQRSRSPLLGLTGHVLGHGRVGVRVAALIFAEDADLTLEDYARIFFEVTHQHRLLTWTMHSGPLARAPADALKVYPQHEPLRRMAPSAFEELSDGHCRRSMQHTTRRGR